MENLWYCPSCRSSLPEGEPSIACPACNADFGPNAAWGPVTNNKGRWTPREREGDNRPSLVFAIFQCIARLFIGGLAWVAVLALLILSAVPYGGGSKDLFSLLQFTTVVVIVWAAIPVAEALYQTVFGSRKKSGKERV